VTETPLETMFAQWLRSRGLAVTPERLAVAHKVAALPGHAGAEEITRGLIMEGSRVSRASVYRTLGLLVEARLVARLDLGSAAHVFEPVADRQHHDHLICVQCGRVAALRSDRLEKVKSEVCRDAGFKPQQHVLTIYGLCRDCG